MNAFIDRCKQFLLPTRCLICQQSQAEHICTVCLSELAFFKMPRCTICATPSRQWVCRSCAYQRPAFDATYCVNDIESRLQIPLKNLKAHSSLHLIDGIVNAWEKLRSNNYAPVDLLLPVPLCQKTLSERGFNQAWEICQQMSMIKKIPTTYKLLKKYSRMQKAPKSKIFRTQFLKESFYLDTKELIKIKGLKGKRIGVVDDFMDSGATLNAIAQILKENGAAWVSNWVILRHPSPELY